MKNILVIGAGRSSSALIKYLLDNATNENWFVTVADMDLNLAQQKVNKHPKSTAIALDINKSEDRENEIKKADVVVSMLPAHMHYNVAKDCVRFKKHMVTASYVSDEIKKLNSDALKNNVLLLNETGLDPGIDHMSAMQVIDSIKNKGEELLSFKSYCGGLVAPESNDNPWGYKFSWNPRNVILAGQGTAKYIENSVYKYIPYNRLFTQTEKVSIVGLGDFDAYANRDSLSYREHYGLQSIPTMLRGTLRYSGYCKAWNVFVKLGLTDDSYAIERSNTLSYRKLTEAYLPAENSSVKEKLKHFMGEEMDLQTLDMIEWAGILDDIMIPLNNATPAQILQQLLEQKWLLKPTDKDMIVMQHQFGYKNSAGVNKKITSSLVVKGDDNIQTAMAKTVGLPMAICLKLILQGKITLRGVQIPVSKDIYEPVLNELKAFGIQFHETED